MSEHLVIYNQGAQSLKHVPIDHLGRPTRVSSASWVIVDLREGVDSANRTVASGTATVDSTSTTLSADAGPSTAYPDRLSLTSASGFVDGRTYLLSDGYGRREAVKAVAVDVDSNYLYGAYSIREDFVSGDDVQGIELAATFPLSEANSDDETVLDIGHPGYQLVWTYTIDGRSFVVGERVRVSRYSVQPWITADDVLRGYPPAANRSESVHAAIACACEDIQAELEAAGHDPSLVRMGNTGRVMTRHLALHYLLSWMHGDDDTEMSHRFYARYRDMLHQVIGAGGNPRDVTKIDQSTDGPDESRMGNLFIRG